MIDRVHRELTQKELARIAETYHTWRGDAGAGEYADVPGFCKSATLEEIQEYDSVLTPGRYVGIADVEDDEIPFEKQIAALTEKLHKQLAESDRLGAVIKKNLETLGYRGEQ